MEDNKIQELWNTYKGLLLSTKRENIDKLVQWLDETDFKFAPASTQYHSSYRGGLLQHSLNVYDVMRNDFKHLIEFYEIPEESVILTALLHDICKVQCYEVSMRNTKNDDGQWIQVPYYTWNEQLPWGHGAKSVILIQYYGVHLNNVEISMIINHMGFTGSEDDRRVSKLFDLCPQSLVLYYADLTATKAVENCNGPQRFMDKLTHNSITESLQALKNTTPAKVNILGVEYELAPENAVVDDETIIEVPYNGTKIKVYSPYGDGLPF